MQKERKELSKDWAKGKLAKAQSTSFGLLAPLGKYCAA